MYKLYSTAAVADSSSRGKRKLLVILVGLCCVGTPVYTAELRYQYCAVNVSAVEADKRMAANYRYPLLHRRARRKVLKPMCARALPMRLTQPRGEIASGAEWTAAPAVWMAAVSG